MLLKHRLFTCLVVILVSLASPLIAQQYQWSTFAGTPGSVGSTNGTGSAARFSNPSGTAVDSSGNVYVADFSNQIIRKITPAGVVTTLAGSPGSTGSTNGTGSAARFYNPSGVAVDSSGNVYVADYWNHTIRKITPAGVVSTLAGTALAPGTANGTGSAARFTYPHDVAVDSSGNVYVADNENHTIRKVTAAGVVTTLAGSPGTPGTANGTGSAARFSNPAGVAVDSSGNVYVGDRSNHTIRKITPAGVVTTLAGSAGSSGSTNGTGSAARFYFPAGVAVDADANVYVGDTYNDAIRKITPGGVVTTIGGVSGSIGSTDGLGTAARFDDPFDIAVSADGRLYVPDRGNDTIRRGVPFVPEISITGNAQPIASGASPSLSTHTDFGSVSLNGSSITRTFTISNQGWADLTLTGSPRVQLSGSHAADFTVAVQPVSPVAAGSTTTFQITFTPTITGDRSATVTLVNNDSDEGSYSFSIRGTGMPSSPVFNSASDVALTAVAPVLTGFALGTPVLGFAPEPGTSLTVVRNTGLGFITGQFSDLAQGQTVTLSYGGVNYDFVANYFGGTGNDLVLVWKDTKAWAWGANVSGQIGDGSTDTTGPQGKLLPTAVATSGVLAGKTVVSVAAGDYHSLALCSDGTLAAWGLNGYGQLGNNSTTNSLVPVVVSTGGVLAGKTVVAVAAGSQHSLALCSDGTLAAWGSNGSGELGNNSTTNSLVPVVVSTGGVLAGKTVVAVEAGSFHSLALCSDGTLAAWGSNITGQLGNNSTTNSLAPVVVSSVGVLAGKAVVAVAGGRFHSLALCSDGTLAAWGYNTNGQLGNNSTTTSLVPVAVSTAGVLAGKTVVAVAAGEYHSLARCSDGTLASWGSNERGQLGNNSTTTSLVPAAVSTAPLATGQRFSGPTRGSMANHTLAVVASPPSPVVSTLATTSITGTSATLNGTVNAVGGSATVTFEYGLTASYGSTVTATSSPVTGSSATNVSGVLTGLLPGTIHRYRVRAESAGGISFGNELTFTTLSDVTATFNAPTDVPVTTPNFTASGGTLSLALGFAPPPGTNLTVIQNTGLGFITGQFTNLAQGQTVTLSYDGVNYDFVANYYGGTGNDLVLVWKDMKAWAWGANVSGQIGDGSTDTTGPQGKLLPTAVATSGVLAGKTVVAVAAGQSHSLVLCSDGTLATWGDNAYGQLGNNSTMNSLVPVAVSTATLLAGKTVVAVAAGRDHNLALCSDGTLAAWGFNFFGQLGNNSTTNSSVPMAVSTAGVLAGKTVVAVVAGEMNSLVLCSDGTLAAWGNNFDGQLGNNSTTNSLVPVVVSTAGVLAGKTVVAVAAGGGHNLALCSDGTLAAWGRNNFGQLGDNSTTNSLVPVAVSTVGVLAGKTVVAVAAGGYHSVALCSDGTLAAWGWNTNGQLGNNSTTNSLVPTEVSTVGMLSGKTVVAVAAGWNHSLALCSDGTLASWGYNFYGQLGNNSTTNSLVPVEVSNAPLTAGRRFSGPTRGSMANHTLALVASPPFPVVSTLAATSITDSSVTLNGTVNAVGGSATVTFEYGLTTSYGSTVTATPSPITGTTATSVTAALTALEPRTTYHYRLTATNAGGTTTGEDLTFTTLDPGFWYVQRFEDHTNFPSVATLSTADALIASGARIAQGTAAQADLYGTSSTNPAGRFTFDYPLPGYSGNRNDYAVKATARFVVMTAGDYTFAANTDDGVRVKIDGTTIIADDGLQAQVDSPYVVVNLSAGTHRMEWVWFEHLGMDVGEVFAAPGVHTGFNSSFKLVGDPTLFGFASGTPEIALEQPEATDLISGTALRDFGSVNLGSTASLTFTVRNTGTADLNDLGIVLSGTNAADFVVIASPVAPVIPGGNTTFAVRFVPTAPGNKAATLQLASNDADEAPFVISLTGNARTSQESWRQSYFGTTANTGNAADAGDPDGDGDLNVMEFAYGTNPTVPDSGVIVVSGPAIVQRGSPTVWLQNTLYGVDYRALFGRRKDYLVAGLTYTVQFSSNLTTWETSTATPSVVASDAVMDAVTVPYPFFLSTGAKAQFFRVVVTGP